MTEFVQMDPSQIAGKSDNAGEVMAGSWDWRLGSLFALSVLFLITAVVVAIYALLLHLFLTLNLPRFAAALPGTRSAGLVIPAVLGIGFALLAALFYLAARSRLTRNRTLQATAGCPSCRKNELMRVSRTRRDRLITLSGIRVARYQCRDCLWNGRRVFRKSFHPLEIAPYTHNLNNVAAKQAAHTAASPPQTVPTDSKPAETAGIPAAPSQNGRHTAVTAPSEAGPGPTPAQNPALAATLPTGAKDSNGSEPAQQMTVISLPKNAALPSNSPAENAQLVETVSEVEACEVDQEQLPISGERAKIATTFGINLRKSPHAAAQLIGLLGPETVISLLHYQKQEDGAIWYYIKAGEQRGWVCSSCLEEI